MATSVTTKMSESEIEVAAKKFDLTLKELNIMILPTAIRITASPGNARQLAFLDHLRATGKAE